MPHRRLVLLLPLAACHGASSPVAPDGDLARSSQPGPESRYTLFKFLNPIGTEVDTFLPTEDGGVEAKALFTFNDRGSDVTLAASYRIGRDGLPRRYDAWGSTSRFSALDDQVRARGDGFAVGRLGAATRTVKVAPPYAMISGYAPMLAQELLLRTWVARGRPARLPMLPEGEVRLSSRGHDPLTLDSKLRRFEHVAIEGLAWGRSDAWLDEQGRLAAVVTRDAEYDHFEGVRSEYAPLIDGLVARAGDDAIAWLGTAAQDAVEGPAGAVALVGARLIDGSGAVPVDDAVVVYDGDRIVAAGPRATTPVPAGARSIDVRGKFIIPGLWDMHAHVEQVEQLGAYLAAGVTTVRDVGNILEFITAVRDAVEAGRGVGPRVIVDGLVDSTAPRALGRLRVDRVADVAPMIERLHAAGCAEVKIYSSLQPELVAPLAAEAHRRGLRVTGHIPTGMDVVEAVDAGFDGVNHITSLLSVVMPKTEVERAATSRAERQRRVVELDLQSPVMQRVFARLAEKQTLVDPTLALYELLDHPVADLARREPGLAKLPRQIASVWQGIDPADTAYGAAAFQKALALVRELHRRGVPIVAGTDQSVIGHSLHRELELYVEAGFTPMEALQSATTVPARALGRTDLGTIAVGKRADLLVLDGDPLADIHNTRRIALVVARGRGYRPAPLWTLSGFQP